MEFSQNSYNQMSNVNNQQNKRQSENNYNYLDSNNFYNFNENINFSSNKFSNNSSNFVNYEKNIFNSDINKSINSFNNYDSQNDNQLEGDEFKVDIYIDDDNKEILTFNLKEDIYQKVNLFCKQKNYGLKVRNFILKEVKSQIDVLINKIENENNNSLINNINNKRIIKKNKSFDILVKKNKFCKTQGDIIGQKLYEKGLKFNLIKKKKIEKRKLENENSKISPEETFHPKISKKSQKITKNMNKSIKIEDRLIALGKEREKKILKKVAEKSFIENNKYNLNNDDNNKSFEYTYKPKINKYNLQRNKSEDIFTKLYKTAEIRKNKNKKLEKQIFQEKCPFKPKITKMAQNMNDLQYKQIMERFYEKNEKKKEEIKGKKEEKNKGILKLPPFKKKLNNCKKSCENDNLKKKKVYNKNNNEENKRKEIIKKNYTNYSNGIINHFKEVKFKEIFDLLDKDKKGYISYTNISFSDVPEKILLAISAIIEEINRDKNKKFDFQDFKELTDDSLSKCMMNS